MLKVEVDAEGGGWYRGRRLMPKEEVDAEGGG